MADTPPALHYLTPVFDPSHKPIRSGVYLTHIPIKDRWAYFDQSSMRWTAQCKSVVKAFDQANRNMFSGFQAKPWQGLMEKPNV